VRIRDRNEGGAVPDYELQLHVRSFGSNQQQLSVYCHIQLNGESIIDNNTFISDSGNSRCYFIAITNVAVNSGTFENQLLVSNNTQLISPFTLRHLLDMEEFLGTDFQLFINNNTTISEGNVPVLLANAKLDIFRFIELIGNSVQNTAGKGLSEVYLSYIGTTDIYSSGIPMQIQSLHRRGFPRLCRPAFLSDMTPALFQRTPACRLKPVTG
jgi:hypothetical protein